MSDKRLMSQVREGRVHVHVVEHGLILSEYDYDLDAAILSGQSEDLLRDAKQDHPDLDLNTINRFVRRIERRKPSMVQIRDANKTKWEEKAARKAERLAAEEKEKKGK